MMVESPPNNRPSAAQTGPASPVRRLVRRLFRVVTLAYCGILTALVMLESRLIYPAPQYDPGRWDRARRRSGADEVWLRAADGQPVCAWLVAHPQPQHFGVYCHENGVDVADCAAFARQLADRYQMTVLLPEYRGYGSSHLTPSEAGITQDVTAAMGWFCEHTQQTPQDMVVIGRSLGGGLAMSLAEGTKTKATILLSTFSSLPDVAASMYWFMPVRCLMRNRYASARRMVDCHQPLLQFHGDCDEMIPLRLGRKLFAASPARQKKFVTFPQEGHNYLLPDVFWSEMDEFMTQVAESP